MKKCINECTSVCTISGLCMRKLWMIPYTSTKPSRSIWKINRSMAMKVPVRPTPALYYENKKCRKWYISLWEYNNKTVLSRRVCIFESSGIVQAPAVHKSGWMSWVLVHVFSHQVSEVDEKLSGLRNSMVWPCSEMEVTNWSNLCCFHLSWQESFIPKL